MNDSSRTSRPSILPSIRPSGVFPMELPFGPPPDAIQNSPPSKFLNEDLRRTIRALSSNAGKILHRSPLISAMCWHEAGRLLERRADRRGEAWICFNRALAVFPDYRPSLLGLIRIARLFGANDVLLMLLDAYIDRVNEPSEKTALLTEAAALHIRSLDFASAKKKLKTAIALSEKALIPRILAAVISSHPSIEKDAWSLVLPLYEVTKGTPISASLARYAAEKEDRAPRESTGGVRPRDIFGEESSLPVAWIEFRTHLRRGLKAEAEKTLEKMVKAIDDPLLGQILLRLRNMLRRMNGKPPLKSDETDDDVFHRMVEALLDDDREEAPSAVEKFRREVRDKNLKDSLSLVQMAEERRSKKPLLLSFGPTGVSTKAAKAVFRFLKTSAPEDTRDPALDAALLERALLNRDYPKLMEILRGLRDETVDADARWPLKVAECALELEIRPKEKEKRPSSVTPDEAYHTPLPSMIRRAERRHRHLAELCLGEARNSDDPHFVASRLAWAGFHLETLDPFESARLYTEALSCNPSLLFAVKGLERTGTMGREAATLYRCAAQASSEESTRAAALLREAMLHLAMKNPKEAALPFCEAATLLPKDETLQRVAFRFASSYPKRLPRSYTTALLDGTLRGIHPCSVGAWALFSRPDVACSRFEEAQRLQPGDPLAKLGLKEALFRADRASVVSNALFEDLKEASSDGERAFIYQRLAHIDRFYQHDESSASMFKEALFGLLPGHRSSIVHIAVYALKKQQCEDFRRALTALSLTTSSSEDARVYASLCTISDPSKIDLVKHIAAHSKPTLLDLTFLEAIADDDDERLPVLEKILSRNPASGTYLSRYADALAKAGRFDEAVVNYKQSLESRLTVFHNLHEMSRCLKETDAYALLVDTLVIAADMWTIGAFKAAALSEAAALAYETIGDATKAADLCLLALKASPEEESAFRLGDMLYETKVDEPLKRIELLEAKLEGNCDPIDEITYRAKIRLALKNLDFKESDSARVHLRALVAAVRENRPALESKGDERTAAWDRLLWSALETSKSTFGDGGDADLLAALGHLYLKEYRHEALAEQYFQEAVFVDGECWQASGGLAEILIGRGDSLAASKLLEQFNASVSDPKEKLEKLLMNAEILKDGLHNEKEAEQVLKEARKTDPLDLNAALQLADIYEKQNDNRTLSILLDSVLQNHSAALKDTPDNQTLYRNLLTVGTRRGDDIVLRRAADMITFFQGDTGLEAGRSRPLRPGTNLADPSLDERLCPAAVSAGLRKILSVLEIPVGRMLGVAADQMNLDALEKTKRKDKIATVMSKLAPMFGMASPEIRVGLTPSLLIAPGPVPAVLMPEAVLRSESLGVKMFAAAVALMWSRLGLAITTCVPMSRLRLLLCGFGRIFNPDFAPNGFSEEQAERDAAFIREAVSAEALESLKPYARCVVDALSAEHPELQFAAPGHRAGLLSVDSLSVALCGLRAVTGIQEGPLSCLPGAGMLISFAFSLDYVDIIRRLEAK